MALVPFLRARARSSCFGFYGKLRLVVGCSFLLIPIAGIIIYGAGRDEWKRRSNRVG